MWFATERWIWVDSRPESIPNWILPPQVDHPKLDRSGGMGCVQRGGADVGFFTRG